MLLSIILGIVIVALTLAIILLVSPFSFILQFKQISTLETALLKMYWLHPRILSGSFDFKNNAFEIIIFNHFKIHRHPLDNTDSTTDSIFKKETFSAKNISKRIERSHNISKAKTTQHDKTGQVSHHATIENPPGDQRQDQDHFTKSTKSSRLKNTKKTPGIIAWLCSIPGILRKSRFSVIRFFIKQKIWHHKIIAWLLRSISSFFHLFTMHGMRIYVRAGLDDPSETGKYFGYWQGISHAFLIDNNKKFDVTFIPVFTEACFEMDAQLCIRSSLLQLLKPAVVVVATFPYVSTFMVWYSFKRLEKKRRTNNPAPVESSSR